jgi:hypothetical protein
VRQFVDRPVGVDEVGARTDDHVEEGSTVALVLATASVITILCGMASWAAAAGRRKQRDDAVSIAGELLEQRARLQVRRPRW